MRGAKFYEQIGLTSVVVIESHRTHTHSYGKERYTERVAGVGVDGKYFDITLTYIFPPRSSVPACRNSEIKPRVSLVEISKERFETLKAGAKS